MKTINFEGHNYDGSKHVYECSEPGDQSGEYVRIDDVYPTTKTEYVVQSRPAGSDLEFCDLMRDAYSDKAVAVGALTGYRDSDMNIGEYRVVRRETIEFVEVG